MKAAIEITSLGKEYTLSESQRYLSLRELLSKSIKNYFRPISSPRNKFWALKNINLQILPGEKIGIIGLNGAGKSTLLKIISRITHPSTGELLINGSVGSLLEVGTGFHPELTGKENIYLNGSILGLKRNEIKSELNNIIDFSGVEKFIDTPLKHYSSGMQMRLAFAVASHLRSDILLIDEVLAVGDHEFQQKCIGKMEDINKSQGRTILFVSHDLSAISRLTQKSIFLDRGKLVEFDNTIKVIGNYSQKIKTEKVYAATPLSSTPQITKVELICSDENIHAFGRDLKIRFEVNMPEENMANMALSFQVINLRTMQPILHYHIFDFETKSFRKKGINKIEFCAKNFRLYKGDYFLRIYLAESKTKIEFERLNCCYFRVEMIGIKEIEWGWADDMCAYLDEGEWEIIS